MPPFEHVEFLTLVLGLLVLAFVVYERHRLAEVQGVRLLFASFGLLLLSWTASVGESFLWPTLLDGLQHVASVGAALVLMAWAASYARGAREESS